MSHIRDFWKLWVCDSAKLPITWTPHPHEAFRLPLRFLFALLGSIVPVGIVLIYSDVLGNLEKGVDRIGLEFIFIGALFATAWLISVIVATSSEEKSIVKHIFLGASGPANLALLLRILQDIGK